MWYGTSPDPGQLQTLTEQFSQREIFQSAQPITVRLRGVMVRTDYEWALAGSNDLMIVTKFQVGDEPPVERLLFMQHDAQLGWQDDFFNDVIFSTRDFTGERITLRLQVYDIDNIDQGLVQSAKKLSKQVTSFPVLAQYKPLVDVAFGPVVKLVDTLDDHDQILDDRVTLEIAEPGTGHKLLQPGYLVHSRNPIDTASELGNDLRIRDSNGDPYEESGYAVLEVRREALADRQYEIDQKAAKLVSELQGKGQSGESALSYLRDTLRAYSTFQDLQRAHDLQSRENLTDAQKRLLEDLKSAEYLKPYLTNG